MPTSTKTTSTPDATTITPSFEFFQGVATESASKPRITVRRGGLMVITKAAADMLGEGADHIQLAYDRNTGAVGMRAVEKGTAGCYRLRSQRKSASRIVGGKRFFSYHEIDTAQATTYEAKDFGGGIIGFVITAADESTVDADVETDTDAPVDITPKTTAAKGRKSKAA